MQLPTKASLVHEYLTYGLTLEEAQECAEYEFNHRVKFLKLGSAFVEKIDKDAKEFNKKKDEQKKLSISQLKYKKRGFEQRKRAKESSRKYNHARPVVDPNGIAYKTTGEMCKIWGTMLSTYCNRRAKGWTMLEALIGKSKYGL